VKWLEHRDSIQGRGSNFSRLTDPGVHPVSYSFRSCAGGGGGGGGGEKVHKPRENETQNRLLLGPEVTEFLLLPHLNTTDKLHVCVSVSTHPTSDYRHQLTDFRASRYEHHVTGGKL